MIELWIFGRDNMQPLENKIDIEGLENLKKGDGVQVDQDTKYDYASELSTEGVPLIDPGQGKTVSIRAFMFKIDPSKVKQVPTSKQQIFEDHAGFIRRNLWGDGLIPVEGIAPRVIINKKKYVYQIFVTCEARLNTIWIDKPNNLSALLVQERNKNGKLESQTK